MWHKNVLRNLTLVAFLVFCTTTVVSAEPITLKFAYWAPPVSAPAVHGIIPWAEKIEKETKGRVKVSLYGGEAMAKAPDHYDLVLNGTADIAWIDPNFTPGVFPLSEVFSLPFLFPSAEIASAAMWRMTEKYLADTDFKRVKVLWAWSVGVIDMFSNRPVSKLEDFNGMKLAAMSPVQSKIYKALGAKGVTMIEPDVYTSLERGMIDGRFHNWEGAWVFKNNEVTEYRTKDVKISTMPNVAIMNRQSFDKLPDDIKQIIDRESGLFFSMYMGKMFDAVNAHFVDEIIKLDKEKGKPAVIELDTKEKQRLVEATQPVIDEWIESRSKKAPFTAEMVQDLQEMVKMLSLSDL